MKRFACALALVVAALMLPRTASAQSGLVWTTNGVLSNPATNAIFNPQAAGTMALSWMQNDAWVEGAGSVVPHRDDDR